MEQGVTTKAADVFMHHVTSLVGVQLEEVMLDYTDASVLMSPDKTFHGLSEIRAFFQASIDGLPPEFFSAITPIHQDIQGEVVYSVWKAEPFVKMGTDTFVIRDGKILAQTFLMTS